MKFPKSFLWGAAVSAYQVEGGNKFSDWWHWEIKNKKPRSGKACNFWNKFSDYFDYLEKGKMNAFRLSVEWARVNPQKDKWDSEAIARYKTIIRNLKQRKIEPVLTLWHFSLPQWLAKDGGWLNPLALEYFEKYVVKIRKTLGEEIKYWTVLNEPGVYVYKSFIEGDWPPQKKYSLFDVLRLRKILVKAHRAAYSILKTKNNFVSSAFNLSWDEPKSKLNPFNKLAKYFLEEFSDWGFLKELSSRLDFVGVNYYFHNLIDFPFQVIGPNKNAKEFSDIGWEIYPKGVYYVSKKAFQKYKKPLMITENGLADKKDLKRGKFLQDHIFWLNQSFQEGVQIIGYLHWSLMDNFEWSMGKNPRFGLLETDYKNMTPKPRKSFWLYKKLIESHTEIV
ncbi:MAG: Beta-glucosidase A [Parcubacteria group bacterium GW2011_GWC1_45_9]|nr:MAG: Beta-glucosidase A [Parcubacteria group bacterium GW2011_GWB1_45_10]KKU17449.1 MAG: Beta-glucosidase A [Parcubacteria group bacterium GW2011_GWC1_45_9]HCI05546.1 glycoside hydrolase family 1 protein [Patescibacteria group bacterium]